MYLSSLLQLPLLDLAGCKRMQDGCDQLTQVGIQVGGCTVTISGPLPEVLHLLNHLAFGPEAGVACQSRPYSGPRACEPLPASPDSGWMVREPSPLLQISTGGSAFFARGKLEPGHDWCCRA